MGARLRIWLTVLLVAATAVPVAVTQALAGPNLVATTEATYQALARVFSDPQGCLSYEAPQAPPGVSPWAKGRGCAAQFLSYQEAIDGARFLESRFPDFVSVIRLDQAYDDPNFRSAGIARGLVIEDGTPKLLDRDRRPLYLLKVTDRTSATPEPERRHFVYGLSIHGIERAGVEGGVRAMEDLVTWAACEREQYQANTPACDVEGPFPKPIVEGATERDVPTAGEALQQSVIYFQLANPDGWARGQADPVELRDGSPNVNYTPGAYFQRYNGNGMDMNRDWPGEGYTYRPYTPASEPETKAFSEVLRGIRQTISPDNPVGQRFAGGIDLHGQLVAEAYSFTLLGAGQRDYRKNLSTVDQALRTWEDQTQRLAWSPYIGTLFPVADQWGTVIDTLGYQVSGAMADWYENEAIGLGAVGIDNEMSLSHIAPNTVFDPVNEQMHVDGNKGLIYSQLASMLTEQDEDFILEPGGKIGYVENPVRIEHPGSPRLENPGLPAQNDVDVLVPCQSDGPQNLDVLLPCKEPGVTWDQGASALEFDVKGPEQGFWNGGLIVTATHANAAGMSAGSLSRVAVDHLDEEGEWVEVTRSFVQGGSPDLYLTAGQIATVNDPLPGRWRVRFTSAAGLPARVSIDFHRHTAEASPGQASFSASSMDFFDDLNDYIVDPSLQSEAVSIDEVIADPSSLHRFDSLVVVNTVGNRAFLEQDLGLTSAEADAYLAGLRVFAEEGGNLVLTDAALDVAQQAGIVPDGSVAAGNAGQGRGLAARYEFNVPDRGNVCNDDPLLAQVCLPGTAGGTTRVAVEPTPLGYSPDGTLDDGVDDGEPVARMQQWWLDRAAWQDGCVTDDPVTCTAATWLGAGSGQTALGERALGDGVVRVAGAMFPDPNFGPNESRDMRFGVSSYALSFSAWQMFLNLVDYQRPQAPAAGPSLLELTVPPRSQWQGDQAPMSVVLVDGDSGAPLAGRTVQLLVDGTVAAAVKTDDDGMASASVANVKNGTVVAARFHGDDTHLPAFVEGTYHPARGIDAASG